jgi:hypothetical protein
MSKSPTKEQMEFMSKLLQTIDGAYREFSRNRPEIEIEHHSDKDYWTINFKVQFGNSTYGDCVVFYLKPEYFDTEKIFENFGNIVSTALKIKELKRY